VVEGFKLLFIFTPEVTVGAFDLSSTSSVLKKELLKIGKIQFAQYQLLKYAIPAIRNSDFLTGNHTCILKYLYFLVIVIVVEGFKLAFLREIIYS
jgi:hypothetical protein